MKTTVRHSPGEMGRLFDFFQDDDKKEKGLKKWMDGDDFARNLLRTPGYLL
jgi:hypothetical protein